MSDYQQVCPHCGKVIEPGYYAYDQKAHSAWLQKAVAEAEQQAIENFKYRMEQAIQAMEHPTRWIEVPTLLTDEQRKELEEALANPPRMIHVPELTDDELRRELIKKRFTRPLIYPEGYLRPAAQILTDEELEAFKAQATGEKSPVHVDATGHLYTEPDPSHTTIAHMAQYLDPVRLEWLKSLGIDENTPLEWNFSNEMLRDLEQEAANKSDYKCFKRGNHMTLSITHTSTTHTQRFVRVDNAWQIDNEQES